MVWGGVTYTDVRNIIDLTTTQVSDATLTTLISIAGEKLNDDISQRVNEETADYIDNYRENKKDGSNTIYYTKRSWDWYLGDLNNDGASIDMDDVNVWVYNPSAKTKTAATVSAVDETGKITLGSAPASNEIVKITYRFIPISIDDVLIKRAVAELTAATAYLNVDASNLSKVAIGRLSVSKASGGSSGYKSFTKAYDKSIAKINARQMFRKQTGPVRIPEMSAYETVEDTTSNTGADLG